MSLCAKGKELLRELQRSDWLPPYNVSAQYDLV